MVRTGGAGVDRRSAILLGSASVATVLTGCDVRLENDAPRLPGLRTQGPHPDQAVLLGTLSALQGLARRADAVPPAASPWIPPVRAAHHAQVTRLVDVLAALGIRVPSTDGSAAPSPAPLATPPPTPGESATGARSGRTSSDSANPPVPQEVRDLGHAETRYPAGADERAAWSATKDNRPMLVSLLAARRAAALLLGTPPSGEHGIPPASLNAIPIARVVRPAVYGFELIAARTPEAERGTVRATLAWLYGARSDLDPLVGEPTRPSYALPVRVTDGASARQLAQLLLSDIAKGVAAQTNSMANQGHAPQAWAVRVWSSAAADEARWGAPLAPFPGLRT